VFESRSNPGLLCWCASHHSCPNKCVYEFIFHNFVHEGPLEQEPVITHNGLVI